jgi:multidrug efflux pump
MLKQPEVQSMVGVLGFSFSGQGQNAALAFVTLKDWSERTAPSTRRRPGRAGLRRAVGHARRLHLPAQPAAHSRAGASAGFTFRLQDRGGAGHDALLAARNQLLGMAAQSKVLARCAPTAWKTRRSCRSTSTATRPTRWA